MILRRVKWQIKRNNFWYDDRIAYLISRLLISICRQLVPRIIAFHLQWHAITCQSNDEGCHNCFTIRWRLEGWNGHGKYKKKTKMLERTIQPLFLLQQTVSSVQWATTVHKKSNMWTAKDSGRLGDLWERAKRRNTNINQQDGRRSRPLDYPVDRGDRKFLNNNNKKMTTYGIL